MILAEALRNHEYLNRLRLAHNEIGERGAFVLGGISRGRHCHSGRK